MYTWTCIYWYIIYICVCVYLHMHACKHKNNIQKEKKSDEKLVKCQESTIKRLS